MIRREELSDYLHHFLTCDAFNDYAPNGLQIEGTPHIQHLCTAVTASLDVVKKAVAKKADALLVHHGYFWRGEEAVIQGMKRQRIAHLIVSNINLYAFHLPLDCHAEVGNNVCLGRLLNMDSIQTHRAQNVSNLLWSGELKKPQGAQAFSHELNTLFKRPPLHVAGSDKAIQKVAWCSGAAQDLIIDAHNLQVDAYISGEISERTYYQAQELGIHYFACGHHATERYGIVALGKHLSERFNLNHTFIDNPNPI